MLRPGQNIAQLTGLRGIAALGVVLHHAANQLGGDWYLRGQPMVDVFFVLSGFVISYVYLAKGPVAWPAFARARFARIYPLHIATALAMALAGVLLARASHQPAPDWVNPTQALREATLTMAMRSSARTSCGISPPGRSRSNGGSISRCSRCWPSTARDCRHGKPR